jgi:hypothetical protein
MTHNGKQIILAVLLVTTSLCTPKSKNTDTSEQKLRSIIYEWVRTYTYGEREKLHTFYLMNEKLPDILFSLPHGTFIEFFPDRTKIERQLDGNFLAILPYKVSQDNGFVEHGEQQFTFWKVGDKGEFRITMFSSDFAKTLLAAVRYAAEAAKTKQMYDSLFLSVEQIADSLRADCDSVIFYAKIDTLMLFYVATGDWIFRKKEKKNPAARTFKLGVRDRSGREVIPVEYDKIYNPNGTIEGFIEVQQGDKKGLFSLSGKEFLPAEYDGIYPYSADRQFVCIVKKGNDLMNVRPSGEITAPQEYSSFELTKLISNWAFEYPGKIIPLLYPYRPTKYDRDFYIDENAGVIVTPSYLLELGIMNDEYRDDALLNDKSMGMDFQKVSVVSTSTFSHRILTIFTSFMESGISARDYHFERNDLVNVDDKLNPVSKISPFAERYEGVYNLCDDETYREVDSSLLEVRYKKSNVLHYDAMTQYRYYKILSNGSIEQLSNSREFEFTKYVKIDESYLRPCAVKYLDYQGYHDYNLLVYNGLSNEDLDIMRNEIFAEYGYIFKTDKWIKYFRQKPWYVPRFEDVKGMMSDIDRHNTQFIRNFQLQNKGNDIAPDSIAYYPPG